ncbi:hypothetical protein L9F63_008321, partial [Diploptera punctata]
TENQLCLLYCRNERAISNIKPTQTPLHIYRPIFLNKAIIGISMKSRTLIFKSYLAMMFFLWLGMAQRVVTHVNHPLLLLTSPWIVSIIF